MPGCALHDDDQRRRCCYRCVVAAEHAISCAGGQLNKCPVCKEALANVEYEGQRVRQCTRCGVYLVPTNRLDVIKRLDRLTKSQLKAEAELVRGSAQTSVQCPKCFVLMRQQ